MKTCARCGGKIPVWLRIGERVHNLNSRRYCLDCSPFGKHNTQRLEEDKKPSEIPEVRTCTQCKVEKPIAEFYFNSTRKRYQYECRACFNRRSKELQRNRKMQAVVYKGSKCARCGFQGHIAVYDFHHRNRADKHFQIGDFKNRSFAKLKNELDKCVLLCANCHRELEALGDDADWSFIE